MCKRCLLCFFPALAYLSCVISATETDQVVLKKVGGGGGGGGEVARKRSACGP